MEQGEPDIYNAHYRENTRRYARKNLGRQKDSILEFLTDKALEGKKPVTTYKYVKDLRFWVDVLNKPFDACDLHDIREAVIYLDSLPLGELTKVRRKTTLKIFYQWLRKADNPPETSWIKTHMSRKRVIPPQLLIRPEDIGKLMGAAKNTRDKAMIMLHWESGGRVGEILNIRIRDVFFEDQLAVIRLDGKTGPRQIYVKEARPFLQELVASHPRRSDGAAFLFQNDSGRPMHYSVFCNILRYIGKRAELAKPLNPHHFRHSRATFLASKGWSEAQLCTQMGWIYGSKMPGTYIHMAGGALREAVLSL